MLCRHHGVMSRLQPSHKLMQTYTQKYSVLCHSLWHKCTCTLPAAAQGARHENILNWLEGRFDSSGGLREKKTFCMNTHARARVSILKHLTPRHNHHCFALNTLPIKDDYWDSKGCNCYDWSTKEKARDQTTRVRERDKTWKSWCAFWRQNPNHCL